MAKAMKKLVEVANRAQGGSSPLEEVCPLAQAIHCQPSRGSRWKACKSGQAIPLAARQASRWISRSDSKGRFSRSRGTWDGRYLQHEFDGSSPTGKGNTFQHCRRAVWKDVFRTVPNMHNGLWGNGNFPTNQEASSSVRAACTLPSAVGAKLMAGAMDDAHREQPSYYTERRHAVQASSGLITSRASRLERALHKEVEVQIHSSSEFLLLYWNFCFREFTSDLPKTLHL